jgi:hypothetical protein
MLFSSGGTFALRTCHRYYDRSGFSPQWSFNMHLHSALWNCNCLIYKGKLTPGYRIHNWHSDCNSNQYNDSAWARKTSSAHGADEEVKGHGKKPEQRTQENDRSSFLPDIRLFDDCRHSSDGRCHHIDPGDLPFFSQILRATPAGRSPASILRTGGSQEIETPFGSVRKFQSQHPGN